MIVFSVWPSIPFKIDNLLVDLFDTTTSGIPSPSTSPTAGIEELFAVPLSEPHCGLNAKVGLSVGGFWQITELPK